MLYGVKFKKLTDGQEIDYWFDVFDDRQEFIKKLNNNNFIILELVEMKQEYLKFN